MCLSLGYLFPRSLLIRQLWIAPLVLALISGFQSILDISLGVDDLFIPGSLWHNLGATGRMSSSTAFVLFLASLAQAAYLNREKISSYWMGLLATLSSAIAALFGMLGVAFCLLSPLIPKIWESFIKMSPLSAVCSFLIGISAFYLNRQHLQNLRKIPHQAAAIFLGMGFFLLTFLLWQSKFIHQTDRLSHQIYFQTRDRTLLMKQEFQDLEQKLIQLQSIPDSKKAPIDLPWKPTDYGVQAIVRLGKTPELLWDQSVDGFAKDFPLLSSQLKVKTDFQFYESLSFQRRRWMGLQRGNWFILFSPETMISRYFPEKDFLFTLQSETELLFTNSTNKGLVPVIWDSNQELNLWNTRLRLHLDPTEKHLSEMGLSNNLNFLFSGLLLSLASGVILLNFPRLRKRISN